MWYIFISFEFLTIMAKIWYEDQKNSWKFSISSEVFSKGTFDHIRINSTPNYSEFLYY